MSADQDWRLKAELQAQDMHHVLDDVLAAVRAPHDAEEAGAALPDDVAVTHDGNVLFVYASARDSLDRTRRVIEAVLARDGAVAGIRVSRWDDGVDQWVQVDPPPTVEEQRAAEAAERDADAIESRTLIVSAGKWVRAELEQTMREWAEKLGLETEIHEHRHLLTTQVAFTVTGPRRRIDEFAAGLRAQELATLRTERAVMISPL